MGDTKHDEIAEYVKSLTKKERLILATFEGDAFMPEGSEMLWDAKALEQLVDYDLIKMTVAGYELTKNGLLIAKHIHENCS
jgi:hypothetical protein